jgi:hypothetical protein
LHSTGATELRVRGRFTGPDSVSFTVADGSGAPALTVSAMVTRAAAIDEPATGAVAVPLYEVDWQPISAQERPPASPAVTSASTV